MEYFYSEIGIVKTWFLFSATILLIVAAHYKSFRQAWASQTYNWAERPVRSVVSLAVKHEFYYVKKVPVLVASVLILVTATVLA